MVPQGTISFSAWSASITHQCGRQSHGSRGNNKFLSLLSASNTVSVEGNHMVLERTISFSACCRQVIPSVWKAITWLQGEQASVQTVLEQDAVGNPSKRLTNKGLECLQKRLKTLCQDRVDGAKSIPEFLSGIGYNIRFNRRQ